MVIRFLRNYASILVLALVLQGCVFLAAGAVVGTGAYAVLNGWVTRDYQSSVPKVYAASLKACSELGLPVSSKEKTLTNASIKAKDGDSDVWIKISAKDSGWVKVEIKDGVIGNEQAAKQIHEKILSLIDSQK